MNHTIVGEKEIINKIIYDDLYSIYKTNADIWGKFRGKAILITGATGLIGTYMTYMLIYLNEYCDGYDIQIIIQARSKNKVKEKFGDYINKSYFIVLEGDVCGKLEYEGEIDYIIHTAALASPQYHNTNSADVMTVNILGTHQTLELARKKKSLGYLFFSANVFGKLEKEIICESDCGTIEPLSYKNCYTESKRAGEVLCACYSKQYGVPTRIVRPCHTYGPTMDIDNDQRVFSSFVGNVIRGENIIVKSDGLAVRNFCYISDAISGFYRVLLSGDDSEIYNVSNMNARCSIRELANILCNICADKKIKVSFGEPDASYSENIHKIIPNYSTEKLEGLGWKPGIGIEEGFSRTIDAIRASMG